MFPSVASDAPATWLSPARCLTSRDAHVSSLSSLPPDDIRCTTAFFFQPPVLSSNPFTLTQDVLSILFQIPPYPPPRRLGPQVLFTPPFSHSVLSPTRLLLVYLLILLFPRSPSFYERSPDLTSPRYKTFFVRTFNFSTAFFPVSPPLRILRSYDLLKTLCPHLPFFIYHDLSFFKSFYPILITYRLSSYKWMF